MLRKILNRIERLKKVPFIADKGYDAVDHAKGVVQKVFDIGFVPPVKVKETFRMNIRHPLRKISKENYKKYGKVKYRIESLFGTIKQKLGSGLRVIREDIARKMVLACATPKAWWNFYPALAGLALHVFLTLFFFLRFFITTPKVYFIILEQPHIMLDLFSIKKPNKKPKT